jgi:hypothetical protein
VAQTSGLSPSPPPSRLILQDAGLPSEAPAPHLRMSWELAAVDEANPVRAQAQQTWQALQLQPEQVIAQTAQLREADARAAAATNQVAALRSQTLTLQSELDQFKDTRWQHPAVYTAGAVLLGFTWLWLSERKKRIAAQALALQYYDGPHSVLGGLDGAQRAPHDFSSSSIPLQHDDRLMPQDSAPAPMWGGMNDQEWVEAAADHAAKLPLHSLQQLQPPILPPEGEIEQPLGFTPAASEAFVSSPAPFAPTIATPAPARISTLGQEPVFATRSLPWWKRLGRRAQPELDSQSPASSVSAGYHSSSYPSTQVPETQIPETQIDPYEDDSFGLDSIDAQLNPQDYYDPDLANIELLSQTRIQPTSNDDAVAHLLELRMAVQALCALEQPQAALNLLLQHIDAVPTTCAWAYMEYLELSSQLSQREAFEGMRKRYRLQFNRLAPYWQEPNGFVQGIERYDRPLAELSAVWSSPQQSRALIYTWLLGNLHARRLFQLPAYHDLLDLYELQEFYDDKVSLHQEFEPTVSLLDLDYEFAVEVELDAQTDGNALRAIPTVKTGDFAVDFNIAQNVTQPGMLTKTPDTPSAS